MNQTGGGLIEASSEAARSVLLLSALVVAFSSLKSFIYSFGAGEAFAKLFSLIGLDAAEGYALPSVLLEVTGGAADALGGCEIFFLVAILSFGGLCVYFQVYALLTGKIPLKKARYYLFRLAHLLLTFGFLALFRHLIRPAAALSSSDAAVSSASSRGVSLSGAALALLCGFFLATLQNGVEIRKEI